MPKIVAIKFRDAGKLYDFSSGNLVLQPNDQVIVETDRGRALGTVVLEPREVSQEEMPEKIKSVVRPATDQDRASAQRYAARDEEAYRIGQECINARKMEMKLVQAEHLFDGSKIIFYFTADGRVDFRELVKDLAHKFHTRIEMRQIGVRDEAKLVGGLGICGRELCCCSFLRDFEPVSVKMAKEQGLALNPSKISGQCGRLLCCLGYEYETYCGMRKCLPKCGSKIKVQKQEAEVISQNVLKQTVQVKMPDHKIVEWPEQKPKETTIEDSFEGMPQKERTPRKSQSEKPQTQKQTGQKNTSDQKDQEGNKEGQRRRRRRPRKRRPSGSGEGGQEKQQQQQKASEHKSDKSQPQKSENPGVQQDEKSGQKPRRRRPRRRRNPSSSPKSDKE